MNAKKTYRYIVRCVLDIDRNVVGSTCLLKLPEGATPLFEGDLLQLLNELNGDLVYATYAIEERDR